MAFLIPPQKRHFYEMLELCRKFNPDLKPGPMGDHSRPEGLITLLEQETVEQEVVTLIKQYSSPNPDA